MSSMGLLLLLLCLCSASASSSSYYLNSSTSLSTCPDSCPDFRSLLPFLHDYDTVYLYPGTYLGPNNTNVCSHSSCNFTGVSLIGLGNPEDIIISGEASHGSRGLNITFGTFSFISNISFNGFWLTTSQSTFVNIRSLSLGGAGITIAGAGPNNSTIQLQNLIFNNNSALLGAAVVATDSKISMFNCKFDGNSGGAYGGAVYLSSTDGSVSNSIFTNNFVNGTSRDLTGSGGALHFSGTENYHLTVTNCDFRNNTAQRSGGALHMEPAALLTGPGFVKITSSKFHDNIAKGLTSCLTTSSCNSMGGAIYISAANATVEQSEFIANTALVVSSTTDVSFSSFYIRHFRNCFLDLLSLGCTRRSNIFHNCLCV
jgi:hypothetical protein